MPRDGDRVRPGAPAGRTATTEPDSPFRCPQKLREALLRRQAELPSQNLLLHRVVLNRPDRDVELEAARPHQLAQRFEARFDGATLPPCDLRAMLADASAELAL